MYNELKGERIMKYTKPQVVAQNKQNGSYACACPSNNYGSDFSCKRCDRAK